MFPSSPIGGEPDRCRRGTPVARSPLPRSTERYGRLVQPPKPATWTYAEDYIREDEILAAARARAEEVGVVAIGSGGGAALRMLAALIDARAVVEIGTGTGVSGLWLMRGMRPDGVLTTVDIETEHQRLARETFNEAGIPAQRVRTIAGAALDVLPRLTDGHYDLVFADGDKAEYSAYLKEAMRLLRPGGVVAFDNALWHDRVADPSQRDDDTVAIRDLGREIAEQRGPGRRPAARRRRPAGREEGVGRRARVIRRSVRDGSAKLRAAVKPSQPSATATMSHSSIRTGALPMICEPGDVGGALGERGLELRAGLVGGEHVAALEPLARAHPPGLEGQARHAGELRVRGVGDVRRQLLLDAVGGVLQGPADGEAEHQRMPSRGWSEPSQSRSARAPNPEGPTVHS